MTNTSHDTPNTPAEIKQMGAFVYSELRRLATTFMKGERSNHTLQVTGLINEAVTRIADANLNFADREHFFASSARIMRNVLVDHAKKRSAAKRGGDSRVVYLHPEKIGASSDGGLSVIEMDQLLTKLKEQHPEAAESIELYYFGGHTIPMVAQIMGVSKATVDRQLRFGRAWFKSQLGTRELLP